MNLRYAILASEPKKNRFLVRFYLRSPLESHRQAIIEHSKVLIYVELDLHEMPRFIVHIGSPFNTTRQFRTLEMAATWILLQDIELKDLNDTIETIDEELFPLNIDMQAEDFRAVTNMVEYFAEGEEESYDQYVEENGSGEGHIYNDIKILREFINRNT